MSSRFYSKVIRYIALVMIIYSFIPLAQRNMELFIGLVAAVAVLNVNDLIRYRFLTMQSIAHQVSFLFSLLCIALIAFFQDTIGTEVYVIYLLVELIVVPKKLPIFLIAVHFTTVFSVEMLQFDFWHALRHELISYGLTLLTILLFRNLMIEKRRVEGLNLELQESNQKLEEYTRKIEKLTITKERTRIAQELHDSMGHALVALNMNLEYAEKVVGQRPVEIKTVLGKTRELTRQSMNNLRQAVKLLKDDAVPNLEEALHTLFDAFQENNHVHFALSINVSDELMDSKILTLQELNVMIHNTINVQN